VLDKKQEGKTNKQTNTNDADDEPLEEAVKYNFYLN